MGVSDELDGLIHLSDISWDDSGEEAIKKYKLNDLLKKTDLVICGFSTIAQEAAILGVPSIRLLNLEKPYFHDKQDRIKIVSDTKILKNILKKENFNIFLGNKKLIEKKFYNKLDNKAFMRFEKFLK